MNAVITSARLASTGPFSGFYLYGWKQQIPKLLAGGYEDPASGRSGTVTSDTVFVAPAFELNNKSVAVGTEVTLRQSGTRQDFVSYEFQASGITGSGTDNRVTRWDGTSAVQDSTASLDDSGNLRAYSLGFSTSGGNPYDTHYVVEETSSGVAVMRGSTNGTFSLDSDGLPVWSGSSVSLLVTNALWVAASVTAFDHIEAGTNLSSVNGDVITLNGKFICGDPSSSANWGYTGTLAPGMTIQGGIIVSAGSGSFLGTASSNTFTADNTFHPSTDVVPVTVQGSSGQTANLLEAKNNAGTVLAKIDASGNATAVSYTGSGSGLTSIPAGQLAGTTINSSVVTSSLTSVGTLTTGATGAGFTVALTTSTITGTLPATNIGSATVALSKIANAAADSKLLGSGASGSGSSYAEITLGTGLTMTGTTLSASGTVTSVSGTSNQIASTGGTTPVLSLAGPHDYTTLTSHGILLGNGTSAVAATAAMTDAQLLIGQTGADPLPKTVAGDVTINTLGITSLGHIPANLGLRGHIDGMLITTSSGSATAGITAGTCRDSTDTYTLVCAGVTKVLGNTWASGTGSNGLDTGSVASSTWYHIWAISQAGGASPDILFSLSATAPTMPATYTLKRRIGAVKSDGSSKLTPFIQFGDTFLWAASVQDVNTTVGTTATFFTLSVPPGLKVEAICASFFGATNTLLSSADQTDETPSGTNWTDQSVAGPGTQFRMRTNTAGEVRARADGAGRSIQFRTVGWVDPRGKNA